MNISLRNIKINVTNSIKQIPVLDIMRRTIFYLSKSYIKSLPRTVPITMNFSLSISFFFLCIWLSTPSFSFKTLLFFLLFFNLVLLFLLLFSLVYTSFLLPRFLFFFIYTISPFRLLPPYTAWFRLFQEPSRCFSRTSLSVFGLVSLLHLPSCMLFSLVTSSLFDRPIGRHRAVASLVLPCFQTQR